MAPRVCDCYSCSAAVRAAERRLTGSLTRDDAAAVVRACAVLLDRSPRTVRRRLMRRGWIYRGHRWVRVR